MYFTALTIFLFIVGALQLLIYIFLKNELDLRDAMHDGQLQLLGTIDRNELSKLGNTGSKATLSPCGCVFDNQANDGDVPGDSEEDLVNSDRIQLIPKMCGVCHERVHCINSTQH